jgi:hypothetical protein
VPVAGRSPNAVVEFTVASRGRPERHYAMHLGRGRMTIEEQPAPEADARVSGDERAWIEAFSPGGSRSSLAIEGDARLAGLVLDACGSAVGADADAVAV